MLPAVPRGGNAGEVGNFMDDFAYFFIHGRVLGSVRETVQNLNCVLLFIPLPCEISGDLLLMSTTVQTNVGAQSEEKNLNRALDDPAQ